MVIMFGFDMIYIMEVKEKGERVMKENCFDFTPRELEVLVHLIMGKSNKVIGKTLFITDNTVKAHLTSIYRKLGVASRVEAVVLAKDLGIIPRQNLELP
jgi:DNA-binding NarL/FixJ family response regulator